MTTKIVITGSSGILGRSIYNRLLTEPDFVVFGLIFSRHSDPKKIKCDLTNENQVFSTLSQIKPDMIIHCAAERRPDIVTRDPINAEKLNVGSTAVISKWAAANNACVLYISSDYVFDGTNPPYDEEGSPNPLNEYGLMKLQSERVVLTSSSSNIVLRLPILYGLVEYVEECAVTVLFVKVRDNSTIAPMSNYEKRFPTHCDDVAQTILNMIVFWSKDRGNLNGVFHYQSKEEMTKLEMALKMATLFNLPSDHIVAEDLPTGKESTKRPFKSELKCDKLIKLGLYHPPRTFDSGIMTSLKQFLI